MSIPKDVQEAMAYAAEIFDDCDNGEWATIRTHIAAQDAEIERLRSVAKHLRSRANTGIQAHGSAWCEGVRFAANELDQAMRSANATDAQTEVK